MAELQKATEEASKWKVVAEARIATKVDSLVGSSQEDQKLALLNEKL